MLLKQIELSWFPSLIWMLVSSYQALSKCLRKICSFYSNQNSTDMRIPLRLFCPGVITDTSWNKHDSVYSHDFPGVAKGFSKPRLITRLSFFSLSPRSLTYSSFFHFHEWSIFHYSFTQPFRKYLFSAYYMPGSRPCLEDTKMSKTRNLFSGNQNKQTRKWSQQQYD